MNHCGGNLTTWSIILRSTPYKIVEWSLIHISCLACPGVLPTEFSGLSSFYTSYLLFFHCCCGSSSSLHLFLRRAAITPSIVHFIQLAHGIQISAT